MSTSRVPRPVDVLTASWAAPAFKSSGFTRKNRVFTATGEHGVHLRIELRLHPLPVRCDTFWFEWTPWSDDDHRHLASRVPIPPTLCLDRDYNTVFPSEYVVQSDDLWRVGADTAGAYGPLLVDQVARLMPYWQQILAQTSPEPPADIWATTRQLQIPRSDSAFAVAEAVVAGRANSVADDIRALAVEYPDNAWTQWWRSLLPAS